MKPEPGELVVGAYLKLCRECSFVDYNVRPPGGGLEGLAELDVVGLNPKTATAYLCEVTTHIRGLLYGSRSETVQRIRSKFKRQQQYAKRHLGTFSKVNFMFWSPVVPEGYLTRELAGIKGLQLVINSGYTKCVAELQELARTETHDTGNDFFRSLQILEHLRR